MNPDNVKQFNNLLWHGVPKKNRDSIRGMTSTRYVDPHNVMFVELRRGDSDVFAQFYGDKDESIKKPGWSKDREQSVIIDIGYLKTVIDNVTADSVMLKVTDDLPLTLQWLDGEDSLEVMIAPQIRNE